MSDSNKDLGELAELRPLRSVPAHAELWPDAHRLGQALQELADEPLPEVPPSGWRELEPQVLRLARRRRWRYHLGEFWRTLGPVQLGFCVAAVAVFIAIGALGVRSLSAAMMNSGRHALSRPGTAATAGGVAEGSDRLVLQAQASSARATLRCGARLEVADGRVEADQSQGYRPRIKLRRGRVTVSVPPLPSGGSLAVSTSDAEVIVHGTRFLVERRDNEDLTAVSVMEGVVEVRPLGGQRKSVFLHAGEALLVPSGAAYVRQLSAQVNELIELGRCDDQANDLINSYVVNAAADVDVSAALYLQGSCAADKGELATALAAFDRVATITRSALRAENALARSAQLRSARSSADGAAAWQRYLLRFPQGQHRESAQRYLRELLPPGTSGK